MSTKLTETSFQNWRSVAIDNQGRQHLLCLGRSNVDVRSNYASSFLEILTPEEQRETTRIDLQMWYGTADRGHWQTKGNLAVPSTGATTAAG